jgi:hypothetical protein
MRGGDEASVRRRLLTGGIARVGTACTPRASWVLVEGDRIAAVGDEGEPGAAPPVRQRWVSPGDVADLPGEKHPRWERVRCSHRTRGARPASATRGGAENSRRSRKTKNITASGHVLERPVKPSPRWESPSSSLFDGLG